MIADKDIFDENDKKIGYWRKLEDGANGDNLYEVYFDDSEMKAIIYNHKSLCQMMMKPKKQHMIMQGVYNEI